MVQMEIIKNRNILYSIVLAVVIISGGFGALILFNATDSSFVEWKYRSPGSQGVDGGLLSAMTEFIENQSLPIHGLLIVKNDYLVYEEYFRGYNQDLRHELWSCTKSVTSTVVGICIEQGYFSLQDKVVELFSDRTILNVDDRKQRMTVEHLLTMTTGFEWTGDTQYVGMRSSTNDWVQYVLDCPMVAEPGDVYVYHTGASHLLSAIIQKTTGNTTYEMAQEFLFDPLGIESVSWIPDPLGTTRGGEGIFMTPRDMARFGRCYLQNGTWNGEQVIPSEWISAATSSQVETGWAPPHSEYGYQWWTYSTLEFNGNFYDGVFAARGMFEQLIYVFPDQNAIVVFTSNYQYYTMPDPYYLMASYILPAITT
jgi:CubicO group peptidase (beta-lactamase class C family)